MQNFKVHSSTSYKLPIFVGGDSKVDAPSPLDEFQVTLCDHYQNEIGWLQPLAWNTSFRIHIKHIYTNLQMITQTVQGRVTRRDPLGSYVEIFQQRPGFQKPRRILIEGKAGVGKSTFLSLIAYDWACGNPALQHFKLVFFMELKQMKGNLKNDIFELLFPRDFEFSADYIFQWIVAHQECILFVLDGYDEVNPARLQDVQDLITRKILRNATVIVTSRPGKGSRTHWFMDLRIEITGFTNENIHEFVFRYFEDDIPIAKSLLCELERHPVAENIAKLPLTAMLICAMWEEMPQTSILSSMSSLFIELTLMLVKIFYARKSVNTERMSSLEEVPEDLFQNLLSLGEISLNGLLNDQLIFDVAEIEQKCTNKDVLDVGLLSKEYSASRLKPIQKCRFLHRSYQEFLAGLWLSNKIKEAFGDPSIFEQVGVYVLQCLSSELNSVLFSFTPGLLGDAFQPFFDLLLEEGAAYVNGDETLRQSFFQVCVLSLYESSQGHLAAKLESQMPEKGVVKLQDFTTTPYAVRALVYFLQNRSSVRSLVLEDCNVSNQSLQILIRFLPHIPSLKELHLLRNNMSDVDSKAFSDQNQQEFHLKKVSFRTNGAGSEGCKGLAELLRHCPRLRELDFSDSTADSEGMRYIFLAFECLPHLSQLHLSGNKLDYNGALALGQALKFTPQLTHLHLETAYLMGPEGVFNLVEVLPEAAPHLQHLTLKNVNRDSSVTESICNAVGKACGRLSELTHLDLSLNTLCDGRFIGECIKHTATLTHLNLSQNAFGDVGGRSLAEQLPRLKTLTELMLIENRLGCEGLASISAAIKPAQRLKSISLYSNVISDEGVASLARALSSVNHLETLELGKNFVTERGVDALISSFKDVPNLRYLGLRGNKIAEAGFVALASALTSLSKLQEVSLNAPVSSAMGEQKGIPSVLVFLCFMIVHLK